MIETCALNGFYSPAQRARFLQAVGRRFSVRTFTGEADTARKSALHYAAERVALPGVRLEIANCEEHKLYMKLPGVAPITGTGQYAAVIADMTHPYARYHAGISGEAFVLEATSLALGTCWVASFKRGGLTVETKENEKVLAVIPFGTYDCDMTPRRRKKLTDICDGDPAEWPIWAYNAAECVRNAPSAVNLQPWRMGYAGRTLMLQKKGLGGDMDMGIALLHMSLGVGEKEHLIRWEEGKYMASLLAEDRIL